MKNILTNWKTTSVAAAAAALALLNYFFPQTFTAQLNTMILTALTAFGFIAAKDGNVTGGTTKQ